MSDRVQFLTGGEFALVVLKGHTQRAHIDEQICEESTCASVRLLAEHPGDWQDMSVADIEAWLEG